MNTATGCGTYSGYTRHKRAGEVACADCLAANREHSSRWRMRTGRSKDLARCLRCGSVFKAHYCAMTAHQDEEQQAYNADENAIAQALNGM